ncbi:LytR/AlgR family response regulator transcription factor [Polaribacter porphyrae]|uniref:DNA-binding response regulator n=1 Tax=Polaribacter porphyrae TaxID=1137780 RepID=A0A2S7WQG4_9FLAO|nr:response regulator [Polaribacter porphyrae]PQJ79860.1 DNA-binding response regulator [Polaribacter porphyrae]
MYNVVIVDDEKSSRQLIREYLIDYNQFNIVAEAKNGLEAVKLISDFKPDLVFLDIQMPGLTGFEVLSKLNEIPQIIFSTAYDQYALKAFDIHALDYLLKPYTKERFDKALQRVTNNNNSNNMLNLMNNITSESDTFLEHILIQKNNKLVSVAVKEITWIEAYGDYSKLYSNTEIYVSNLGITTLQAKLLPSLFVRVHRSSIINITQILEIEKHDKTYTIRMKNKDIVRVSKTYVSEIKRLIF